METLLIPLIRKAHFGINGLSVNNIPAHPTPPAPEIWAEQIGDNVFLAWRGSACVPFSFQLAELLQIGLRMCLRLFHSWAKEYQIMYNSTIIDPHVYEHQGPGKAWWPIPPGRVGGVFQMQAIGVDGHLGALSNELASPTIR